MTPTEPEAACVGDYEARARELLDANAWAYFAGGAADEITLRANREAWSAAWLQPRVLRPLARIALSLPHPFAQRLVRAADLARNRANRSPLRGMITAVLEHQPYRSLPDLRRIPVRCLLRHDPILSIRGASDKHGAVQTFAW